MLKQLIKDVVSAVPPVRRVFEQRDMARVAMEAADKRAQDAMRRAVTAERERLEATESLASGRKEIEALQAALDDAKARQVPEFSRAMYSHWGEDALVDWLFRNHGPGRYLDVGCYHPAMYSNTMALYLKGWTGVNVDPNPFMISQFASFRPRDKAVNCAVGAARGTMDYFKFHDWASSNTGNAEFATVVARASGIERPEADRVPVVPLVDIMEEHFASGAPDFLNIDVEEMDVDVLESNDWVRFRPSLIAVEELTFSLGKPDDSRIYRFLRDRGYSLVSRCIYTNFYLADSVIWPG